MGGFVEIGNFDKHFARNTQKKGLAGKHFAVFFLLDTNYFLN